MEETDQNTFPTATINSPLNAVVYPEGDFIGFSGSGMDTEDGALNGISLVWTSSIDGKIGAGGFFMRNNLSGGTHTITLTVIDSKGATGSTSITLTVTPNASPTVDITSPLDGSVYTIGDPITFSGSGTDAEDGTLSDSSLVWTSSIDGQIGTGDTFARNDLSVGTHTITLTGIDSRGRTGNVSIIVTVNSNASPVADITGPANGSTYTEGDSIIFSGTGTDTEDGTLSGSSLFWISDRLNGQIGTGTSFTINNLPAGVHTITLTAIDSHGAAGTDSISITVNPPGNTIPTATITSPADGSAYAEGDSITFDGSGSDTEEGTLSGSSLFWISDHVNGQIGTGTSFTMNNLSAGVHTITLTAVDSGDAVGTDKVSITVNPLPNTVPTAAITSPVNGRAYTEGDSIIFSGTGTDVEDGTLSGSSLFWTSDRLSGQISTGTFFTMSDLPPGVHTITLTAIDSHGAAGTDSISITVNPPGNTVPIATITSPADGSSYTEGDSITFNGTGMDTEDGTLSGSSLFWTSDRLNGQIGTGTSFAINNLPAGVHTITLTAIDSGDAAGTDSISITVNPLLGNTVPTATITSPADGSAYTEGDSITFNGTGMDTEDGTLSGNSLFWTSDHVNGQIGTGTSFTINNLPAGVHTITLTAVDSGGAAGTDSVSITVNPPPNTVPTATITGPADGSAYTEGDSITFNGTGTDTEDGTLSGNSLFWTSDQINGQIGTGTFFTMSDLPPGVHTITLTAVDSGGAVGTDSISITVNPPVNTIPTATITSPADGSAYTEGDSITFNGTGTDTEDGTLSGNSLFWTSDQVNGQIGTGTSFTINNLPAGVHTITLTAVDSGGAAGTDSISITVNPPPNTVPTATITSPADGSAYTEGDSITFDGTGTDVEDGTLSGNSLFWTSDLVSGQIGVGTSFTISDLPAGVHTITLTAVDSGGAAGTDSISITVNSPVNTIPTATITSPVDGSSYAEGDSITFDGSGSDTEDGTVSSFIWTSSIDGQIGTGASFTRSDLSVEVHTITLTVTDSEGATGTDSIDITVNPPPPNTIPTATITSPADGSEHTEGDSITFNGSGSDAEDGTVSSFVWTSDINGQISTEASFTNSAGSDLSLGAHTITLTVTDSEGATGTDSISITVVVPNSIPTATITDPADSSVYIEGDLITFSGSGSDVEDGDLSDSLVWTSDIDGQIGTGSLFARNDLSVGTHTITLTATDKKGATGSDSITLTVNPNTPPSAAVISPSNDSMYKEGVSIDFSGSGTDTEDGSLSGSSLVWTSDIDGQIGTGTSFTRNDLSVGTHTITLTVTDSKGATGSDSITVTVYSAPNTLPAAVINSPLNDSQFTKWTDSIDFNGTGTDEEDGSLSGGSLVWTSDIDGQIGTGTSFTINDLSVGTHTITLTATDSKGATGSDSITITITVPVDFYFFDDFTTDPDTNGNWTIYRWEGDSSKEAYWDSTNKILYLTTRGYLLATAMFANYDLTVKSWQADFDFLAGHGSGADGMVFMFYKSSNCYQTESPAYAYKLGFECYTDPAEGYGVEFDNFGNWWDSSTNHIAVIKDDVKTHLVSANSSKTEDGSWHHATVIFDNGKIQVFIDYELVIDYTISNMDYAYTGIGFGGATGLDDNNHIIDNFALTSY